MPFLTFLNDWSIFKGSTKDNQMKTKKKEALTLAEKKARRRRQYAESLKTGETKEEREHLEKGAKLMKAIFQ